MAFNFDGLAYSGDLGRLNPEEPEPLEKDICCPLICTKKVKPKKNMSSEQCRTRLIMGNPCTVNCEFAQKLRRKMIRNGIWKV